MKLPTFSFSIFGPLAVHIGGNWGPFDWSINFHPLDKQILSIGICHDDGRELVFDLDWGIGYYPNAHRWPAPASYKSEDWL